MWTFFASVVGAGILEVVSQGASSISFNWWLRGENVNNFSVVIVSDIFIALVFFIIAAVIVVRLVNSWNDALVQRVSSIRVSPVSNKGRRNDRQQATRSSRASRNSSSSRLAANKNSNNTAAGEATPLLLGNADGSAAAPSAATSDVASEHERHGGADQDSDFAADEVLAQGEQQEDNDAAARHDQIAFDAVSLSFHEAWVVTRKFFVVDSATLAWLLVAALCDTVHSLCETYSSGHISVLTQLFLKAAEPLLVWIVALQWRRHETARKWRSPLKQSSAVVVPAAAAATTLDEDDSVPCLERVSSLLWCCRVSNTRLLLSIMSLACVAVGIAFHFILAIRKEHEDGKEDKNPIGFVVMYCFSVACSALFTISFGKYIFLIRRVAVHTDPLDLVDLVRGAEHNRLTEHHIAGFRNDEYESQSNHHHPQQQQQHSRGSLVRSPTSHEQHQRRSISPQHHHHHHYHVQGGSVAGTNANENDDDYHHGYDDNNDNGVVVPDLADDPRDIEVGYQRRSSLASTTDDNEALAWGERVSSKYNTSSSSRRQQHQQQAQRFFQHQHSAASVPIVGVGNASFAVSHRSYGTATAGNTAAAAAAAAAASSTLSPTLGPSSPPHNFNYYAASESGVSLGSAALANNSPAAPVVVARASFATSSASQQRHVQGQQQQQHQQQNENEALAILEQNKVPHSPTSSDVRLVACALETVLALLFSVLLAPTFEFVPSDDTNTRSWDQLWNNTGNGLQALGDSSTLFPAVVTLIGWTLVYAADSVLNHLSAPLAALLNQLATPLTAIVLYAIPRLDPSGDPADKFPHESVGVQVTLAVISVVLIFVGALLMYFAERG